MKTLLQTLYLWLFFFLFFPTNTNAQQIDLLTEPLENRISNIVVYGKVSGNNIPENVCLKINDDIYTVAVNDTGLFMQPYTLNEGINEVTCALTQDQINTPADKQKLSFIDYKLPYITIDGVINGSTINLTASGTSPISPDLTYNWTTGKDNPETINLSSTTGTSVSFQKPSVTGEYYIYCTVTDKDGRRFKAGRFLRIEENNYYLNNENMHAAWVDSIVMYEYQLFRFNYADKLSFLRISEKFNHIKNLGANAVWHTPPMFGGGGNYHPNDYYLIEPEYGTSADYKQFVEKAHEAGLKIIFDIPVGHTNKNHYFLNNAYALKENSPYKDYYYWDGEPGNSNVTVSPDNAPNCIYTNVGNAEFKEYLLRVLEYWVREYDIDGYRYDCGQEIYNRDGSFLQDAQRRLRNIKPDIALFIEGSYHDNPEYLSVADVCYDWILHGWGTLNGFKGIFEQNISIDQFHGDFMQGFADSTLPLRYCNTGYFEPVHQTYGWEQEKTGHIIAFTGFGPSLIYAGTETGSNAGQIDWEADLSMYPFMRKLIRVKKDILGSYPKMTRLDNSNTEKVYSYLSKNGDNRIVVVANLSPNAQSCSVNLNVPEINTLSSFQFQDLINNSSAELAGSELSNVNVSLAAWETKMYWIGESTIDIEQNVESITVTNSNLAINEHQGKLQITYNVAPANALDKRIAWSVDDEDMATISESGLIRATGIKNGTLQVTAAATDGSNFTEQFSVVISNQEEYHNLFANAGFSEVLDFWKLTYYSGLAYFDFSNEEANIDIQEKPTNQWDIQLAQPFIKIEPNKDYILSFDAKVSSEQNIMVSLTDLIWHEALIATEWSTIAIPFTSKDNTEVNFYLMLGNNEGNFYFDNFSIREKEETNTVVAVTLQVDMQNETVSAQGVTLMGSFNSWGEAIPLAANGTVYSTTQEVPVGETIEYKFKNGDIWEEAIPSSCTIGETGNRYFSANAETTLPVVCFNSCEACAGSAILSISEIQGDDDVSPYLGQVVEIQGEVTHTTEYGCVIQDASAIRSGIFVFNNTFSSLAIGTGLKVKGTIDEYNTFTQIKDIELYGTFTPAFAITPMELPQTALSEDYEYVLLTAKNVEAVEADEYGIWTVKFDNGTTIPIENLYTPLLFETGKSYNITGVVEYRYNEFRLSPRTSNDIVPLGAAGETVQITFQVDMQNESVSPSGIFLRGSFNDWSSTEPLQNNGTVYYKTLELEPNTEILYKFVNGDTWEEPSEGSCTKTTDATNRVLIVPNTNTLLEVVCFNSCEECTTQITDYTISANAQPTEGGSVAGTGTFQDGAPVNLVATPNAGFDFVNWTKDGNEVSTNATYTFTAIENVNLIAFFEEQETGFENRIADEHQIILYPNPSSGMVVLEGLPVNNFSITVSGLDGSLMKEIETNNQSTIELDLNNLAAGIYNIVIETEGSVSIKKLILTK